jgi:hypothetical protein
MYRVYILQDAADRFCIGQTDNLLTRLAHYFKADVQAGPAGEARRQDGKTKRVCETPPRTSFQRLRDSPNTFTTTEDTPRAQHAERDPFALKKTLR